MYGYEVYAGRDSPMSQVPVFWEYGNQMSSNISIAIAIGLNTEMRTMHVCWGIQGSLLGIFNESDYDNTHQYQ